MDHRLSHKNQKRNTCLLFGRDKVNRKFVQKARAR